MSVAAEQATVALDGNLDQTSASAQLVASANWFDDALSLTIDMGRVERADSAGVALLLAWQRRAEGNDVELRLVNVPESIRSIIEVCGLTAVLPIVAVEPAAE